MGKVHTLAKKAKQYSLDVVALPLGGRGVHVQVQAVGCLLQVYTQNLSADHLEFLKEISDALQRVDANEFMILLGDLMHTLGTILAYWSMDSVISKMVPSMQIQR